MILTMVQQSSESYDPWVVPSQSEFESLGDTMPLSQLRLHMMQFNLPLISQILMTIILWHQIPTLYLPR
jgi:hypothetical protein